MIKQNKEKGIKTINVDKCRREYVKLSAEMMPCFSVKLKIKKIDNESK